LSDGRIYAAFQELQRDVQGMSMEVAWVMRTKSLGILVGWLAWTVDVAGAVAPAGTPSGARVAFATPVHDFGKIQSGEVVRHDFVFTNVGTATLQIRDVRPGCGCTTAGTWDREVEPGRTGKIPIQFNGGSFSGPVSKSVTVTCNDVATSNVMLQLKANVWTPVSVLPSSLFFALSEERATNETKVVRILNHLETPLQLSEPESTNSSFRAALFEKVPGKEYELRVTPLLPLPAPHATATFVMKTTSETVPAVRVQVSATMQAVVSVFPPVLTLPVASAIQVAKPAVTLRNTGTNALVLSEAKVDVPGAKVDVTELQAGRLFRLTLNLPPEVVLEPGRSFALSVRSNHPRYPEIRVPIQQAVRPAASVPVARPALAAPPASAGAGVKTP
jgi:hypothetical protein